MKWSDVDLVAKRWHIRRSTRKGKRSPFTQPLSDLAISELQLIPRTSEYVFVGSRKAATIQNFNAPKLELDKRMQAMLPHMEPWRLHDIARHTVVSHLAEMGINIDVCDKIIGHERNTNDTKWQYQHSDLYQARTEALALWAKWVQDIANQP
jgi:integrase